mgnify:CR=1 FL=1
MTAATCQTAMDSGSAEVVCRRPWLIGRPQIQAVGLNFLMGFNFLCPLPSFREDIFRTVMQQQLT